MEMAQQRLQDPKQIQEPLQMLRKEAKSLQKISEAVEQLSTRLDPNTKSIGLPQFKQLQWILRDKLFDSETHEPYQVGADKLVATMCSVEFAKAKEDFLTALKTERSGLRTKTIEGLFSPLWATGKTESQAGFAKAIAAAVFPWLGSAWQPVKIPPKKIAHFT